MFVAVEGPNGVGKSTTVASVVSTLRLRGVEVLATTEPTSSALGKAIRSMEDSLAGSALALACAADRAFHVEREIVPALSDGLLVITDRYVPSSLVLQRMDGIPLDEVWEMNRTVRVPDVVIYLEDAAHTIAERLRQRRSQSRLEREGDPELELALYRDAHDFLARLGWNQFRISCAGRAVSDVALDVVGIIQNSDAGSDAERGRRRA